MKTEIVSNPDELQVISNPNQKTTTMAKKSKISTDKALGEFMDQGKTAAYILGGQAIGAQINAIVVPSALSSQSATIQQAARAGIPATLGVLTTLFSKNKHLVKLAMGLGVQSALELIKFVMPDWTPQQGLGEGSSYVRQHVIDPRGNLVTAGAGRMSLPQREPVSTIAAGEPAIEDNFDSMYADQEEDGVDWM